MIITICLFNYKHWEFKHMYALYHSPGHGLCPTDPRMFYFICMMECEYNGKTKRSKSVLFCEARISGDLPQMTAGLACDRVETWPVSPGVTARLEKMLSGCPPTQRPTVDLIRTYFPSLSPNKGLLQTQVHDIVFTPWPIRSHENRYVVGYGDPLRSEVYLLSPLTTFLPMIYSWTCPFLITSCDVL